MKKLFSLSVVIFMVLLSGAILADQNMARSNLQRYLNNTSKQPAFGNIKSFQAPQFFELGAGAPVQKDFTVRMEQGKRYLILCSGDDGTYDIDLYVYDAYGNEVCRDDNTPYTRGAMGTDAGTIVIPMVTSLFKIRVHLFQGAGIVTYAIWTY